MTWDWESMDLGQLDEILPNIDILDEFLEDLLPQEKVHAIDLIEDVVKGDWVLEPQLFWNYIVGNVSGYLEQIKTIF